MSRTFSTALLCACVVLGFVSVSSSLRIFFDEVKSEECRTISDNTMIIRIKIRFFYSSVTSTFLYIIIIIYILTFNTLIFLWSNHFAVRNSRNERTFPVLDVAHINSPKCTTCTELKKNAWKRDIMLDYNT